MRKFNVMALFCEDIREEKGEVITLIGVIPDNVDLVSSDGNVPGSIIEGEVPRIMGKFCAYVRINFDPTFDIGTPELRLIMPDESAIPVGTIGEEVVKKAQAEAKAKGNLLAGVISRVMMVGFRPPKMGPMKLEAIINGESYIAAALTFRLKEEKATAASSGS